MICRYVVEASKIAAVALTLIQSNPMLGLRLQLIQSTVEKVNLAMHLDNKKVDVLVSEPIGTFLFNERMVESFLYARDHFLRAGGNNMLFLNIGILKFVSCFFFASATIVITIANTFDI